MIDTIMSEGDGLGMLFNLETFFSFHKSAMRYPPVLRLEEKGSSSSRWKLSLSYILSRVR